MLLTHQTPARLYRFVLPSAALLLFVLLLAPAAAMAMPPADGLTGARAERAERTLERARERGVGRLPASPFLKSTACGRADALMRIRLLHVRRAYTTVRRTRNARVAVQRLRSMRAALRRDVRRRAAVCVRRSSRAIRTDDGAFRGAVNVQRPTGVVVGNARVLALPVDFADAPAQRAVHTPERYDSMLFDQDYPHGGGSMARYFSDMSYGSFSVDGDVQPWRRMPRQRSAYAAGNAGMGAYPNNSQSLLEDAVAVNDARVDFGRYDNDGPDGRPNSGDDDGIVDAVFLVYAGASAAESGEMRTLWPHAWRRDVATRDRSARGGTIRVDRYAALPEKMTQAGPDGDLLTVGVAAHEYGHVLGLPDLVDGQKGAGPGSWDLMGTGLWGFKHSSRPTGLSTWSRARLGWTTPSLLEGDHVGHQLGSSYGQRTAVKLPIEGKPLHEHFLVERRTQTGFDADLPGDGLLVWHVDDSAPTDGSGAHPRVELVAADGSADDDAGDLLVSGKHLSDSSSPGTRAHDGVASRVAIQNVQATTVDLHAGKASLAPVIDRQISDAGPQAAAPVSTLSTPTAGERVRGTITLTCDATGSPKINRVEFLGDGALLTGLAITPSAASVTSTHAWASTGVADGAHTLSCRARNTSNQWSTLSSVSVTVDNTAPAAPTVSAPVTGAWVRGVVDITARGSDNYGVTDLSYRIDGVDDWRGPWAEASPQTQTIVWDTTTTADGLHALTAMSRDLAGNVSAESTLVSVGVDNTPPGATTPLDGTTTVDADVQASATALDASWPAAGDGAGSGVASYAWRFCADVGCATVLASGVTTATSAGSTGLSLADGSTYYACVVATDIVGHVGPQSCSDGITVDASGPVMLTPNDGPVAPDIDFQAASTALDANWAPAIDSAGVASYEWRFCTAPACGTIVASGSGAGTNASATGLTLLDGSSYVACVRALDSLGNPGAFACSDAVAIDTAAPTLSTPNDGPGAPDIDTQTRTTGLDANWLAANDSTGSGVASYDWRFCTSAACTTLLASGTGTATSAAATSLALVAGDTYYACVRATDAVGNRGTWSCSDGVTVVSGPTVTITAPSSGAYVRGTVAVSANATSSSGITTFEYRIDGVLRNTDGPTTAASPKSSTWSWNTLSPALPDGPHTIEVMARDAASTTAVATISVVVDNTLPTTSHGGIASGSRQAGALTLTSSSSDAGGVTSVEYLVDGASRATTTTAPATTFADTVTWDSTVLLDGNHAFRVATRDAAGNLQQSSPVTLFVVNNNADATPPGGSLTSPASGATLTGTVNLVADATDDNAVTKVEFLIDGAVIATDPFVPAGWTSGSRSRSWGSTSRPNGSYTLSARITDAAGLAATTAGIPVTIAN